MTQAGPDTDELLERTRAGDSHARGALLERHRKRLRRLVALRLDPRLAGRVDPSDVVQEVLAEANARLDDYLRRPPLPFYPWLRQIAVDCLIEQHRRHVQAEQRSVRREEQEVAERSAAELAAQLAGNEETPSTAAQRKEVQERVRAALAALTEQEREVVVLRYLEQLSAREVAAVLDISEAAAKKRALRALQRLRESLQGEGSGGSS
jgi:RNA polymerase sigma-70 factor (ECF subfamily)